MRIGGTLNPLGLDDLSTNPGEGRDIAAEYSEIPGEIRRMKEDTRQGPEFTKYWQIPERRRADLKWDRIIYNPLKKS